MGAVGRSRLCFREVLRGRSQPRSRRMREIGDIGDVCAIGLQKSERLAALRSRTAGYLSGGEQQLLVIGRALMARPKLVMIDEPSLGLAPLMVDEVYGLLNDLKTSGLTLLIVEQNTRVALDLADYGYVMESGRIVLEGPSSSLKTNEDVREFYLGLTVDGERKSFRDMKHYRRRKRWLG